MEELTIKFLNITTIKFIGKREYIELIRKYYPGLEKKDEKENYIVRLDDTTIPLNIKIPENAIFQRCFAGPYYYSWKKGENYFAYSPKDERTEEHLVIRNKREFTVIVNEGEKYKPIIGVSREILIREVISKGYMPIHASVVSKNKKGIIFFGNKNKGKSTSLFSSVLYSEAKPMSGDIAIMVKKDNKWRVIGWPWTLTINNSYFDLIRKKPKFNTPNKSKIKYLPADFCVEFATEWVWEEEVEKIINVELDPSNSGKLKKIKSEELESRLEKYGREDWWKWGDVFNLGKKEPIYKYKELSYDLQGEELTGDIIEFFKEKNNEI